MSPKTLKIFFQKIPNSRVKYIIYGSLSEFKQACSDGSFFYLLPLRVYADQTLPKSFFCCLLLSQRFQFALRRKYSRKGTSQCLLFPSSLPFPGTQQHDGDDHNDDNGDNSVPVGMLTSFLPEEGASFTVKSELLKLVNNTMNHIKRK